MTEITLQAVRAKQTELEKMIAVLVAKPVATIRVGAAEIALHADEHYAGLVLNEDGFVAHHLVLMAEKPESTLTWQAAKDWAAGIGGALPTRQEAALVFANCKPHLADGWHWTSEEHTNESYAWLCHFYYGGQGYDRMDGGDAARAVRRVTP